MMPKARLEAPLAGAQPFNLATRVMLQFFRNFFNSKIGIGVTLGFLALIALAFAGGDVASSGGFGGIAGGDRVASVGKSRISTSDLERYATNAVEQLRADDPKLNMKSFLEKDGLSQVLNNLIDMTALKQFGEKYGIHIGNRLIDSEIAKIPPAQGPDGKFNEKAYQAFLAQKRITDAQLRDELGQALMSRILLYSNGQGIAVPGESLIRFAGIITERRVGEIAMLPSSAFAPKTPPSDAEIAAWFAAHKDRYVLPERRVIRYATFTDAALKSVPAPTEAEIAARYKTNAAQYAASESRKLTQLVLPTDAAAKAVMAEISGGKSLEAAASGKGLSAGSLGTVSKEALAAQTSADVATAAFSAGKGKVVGPLKAPLGWVILRVDGVEGKAARTLDQVRGEITAALAVEKRRAAVTDFSARIEEEFDNGAALSDVAKELGLTLAETPPVLANGTVFGQQGATLPPTLGKLVTAAFAMEGEKQPQLAEVEAGKTFIIYDVSAIAPAAPPPLALIKQQVAMDAQLAKGDSGAKAAAQKVQEARRKGMTFAQAIASLGVALPPVQPVDMPRQQVQAMGQNVPIPLSVLFQMAKGTVKLVGAPQNRGWFVIWLKDAIPGKVDPKDPNLAKLGGEMQQLLAQEYAEQMRAAMRADVGVKRNETAIAAVRKSLGGN